MTRDDRPRIKYAKQLIEPFVTPYMPCSYDPSTAYWTLHSLFHRVLDASPAKPMFASLHKLGLRQYLHTYGALSFSTQGID
jgi:hypothetical protein